MDLASAAQDQETVGISINRQTPKPDQESRKQCNHFILLSFKNNSVEALQASKAFRNQQTLVGTGDRHVERF